MRCLIQRVSRASVRIEEGPGAGHHQSIGAGLLALVGIAREDGEPEADWAADKVAGLRVFADEAGKMNRSLADMLRDGREVAAMVVSQFTLLGDARKGNRPSFDGAAPPERAAPLVERFAGRLETAHGLRVARGVFGAHMLVELENDGPVTILLEWSTGSLGGAE